jgi:hypothetical protein
MVNRYDLFRVNPKYCPHTLHCGSATKLGFQHIKGVKKIKIKSIL